MKECPENAGEITRKVEDVTEGDLSRSEEVGVNTEAEIKQEPAQPEENSVS